MFTGACACKSDIVHFALKRKYGETLYGLGQMESYSGNQHVSKQKCSLELKMQRAITIQNPSITYTADILIKNILI